MKKSGKKRRKSLAKWISDYGRGGQAFLAKKCRVRWATIHDIVTGASTPGVATAKAIEKATNSEVAWESLV